MSDDIRFTAAVNEAKRCYTLPLIQRIANNDMPGCFEPTREGYVAMAQLLMTALMQNEELIHQVKTLQVPRS